MLSLRGGRRSADTRCKMVSAQGLGHADRQTKRAPQSQSRGCSKARRDFTSYVGRRHRVQMVIEGGCRSTCITASSSSRLPAGDDVPAGTLAVVRSSQALRCSTEQNALHTLIHQRHLTPSCGGPAPTAERTLDPARMIGRELDPRPGIREQPGSDSAIAHPAEARQVELRNRTHRSGKSI